MNLEGATEMEALTREQKEQRWQEIAARVDKITDRLGNPVDEGIKETVIVLNLLGFPTIMSCEGHLDHEYGPWVNMQPKGVAALEEQWRQANRAAQAAREQGAPFTKDLSETLRAAQQALDTPVLQLAMQLMTYLIAFYAERVVPHDRRLVINEFVAGFSLKCHGTFLQKVVEPPLRAVKLREYQEEMRTFTAFLKARYFTD
jgi:metal-dependent amidase/aminoacylase/carboxypeptidase family protein